MPWAEVFAAFVICHLAGDYLLQTDWQAQHKAGGLGPDPRARRALFAHVATYTLAFVPALVWLADDVSAGEVVAVAAIIFATHLVQDDRRLLALYNTRVKGMAADANSEVVPLAVDQTFHLLILFALALWVGT